MKYNKNYIAGLKRIYPVGTRIKLIHMEDIQAVPDGTMGTVRGIDDVANILMKWDNGSTLNLVPTLDSFEKI